MKHYGKVLLLPALVCAVGHQGLAQDIRAGRESTGKPYTISVSLRQEYDDNINTTSQDNNGSFKTMVNPGVVFNFPMEQTIISFSYNFGMTYYWDRPGDDFDFSHLFSARLNHKFSNLFQLDFREQFRFAQEAESRQGSSIQRFLGDGFVNTLSLDGTAQWTERFSTITGYGNIIERYDDATINLVNDQVTHQVRQDFQFTVLPATTAVLAYNFETTNYTDGSAFGSRDFDRNRITAGADHYLLENWLISARGGGEFVTYDNELLDNRVNPYGDISTSWTYLPGSRVLASYNFGTNLADDGFAGSSLGHTFRLDLIHKITQKLTAGAKASVMVQELDRDTALGAGTSETINENTFDVGCSLSYAITDYLSIDAGYTFSQVDSDDDIRSYDRNRVYIGVTGKY